MTGPSIPQKPLDPLHRAVDSGDLRLEEGVALACANACTEMLASLDALRFERQGRSSITAYGTLTSAQQLGRKFETKALGPGGLQDVLQQHIDTVLQLRDLFEKAGRAYRDADANTAATLASHTPDG